MSVVVTLNPHETAERLIPLLREYATKLDGLSERASFVADNLGDSRHDADVMANEAGRLICYLEAIEPQVRKVAQASSGLLEHSELEHIVWLELKLRLDEIEEHLRFCRIMVDDLKLRLGADAKRLQRVRKLVEKTRMKSPF